LPWVRELYAAPTIDGAEARFAEFVEPRLAGTDGPIL
jgi:hypothetical protein